MSSSRTAEFRERAVIALRGAAQSERERKILSAFADGLDRAADILSGLPELAPDAPEVRAVTNSVTAGSGCGTYVPETR